MLLVVEAKLPHVDAGDYSGRTATFDLDGRYDTSVAGEVRVEIDGVTNPDTGDCVATRR